MDLGLKDRVAIVGGGSKGIGRAVAEMLAAEGARVVIAARRQPELEAAASAIRSAGGASSTCTIRGAPHSSCSARLRTPHEGSDSTTMPSARNVIRQMGGWKA